jgi:excisionase family DNA binding protein
MAMSEPCLELLTVGDLAPWLRLKRSTLYAWAATGKIPSVKLHGVVRFIRADIERWIHDHACQAVDVPPSRLQALAHTPPSISRAMLKQTGTRIIQREKDRQATPGGSNRRPPQSRKRIS